MSEQVAAPPGWYPDGDGAAGTVRWWSGAAWSAAATPAGRGVAVGPLPGTPPPAASPVDPAGPDAIERAGPRCSGVHQPG